MSVGDLGAKLAVFGTDSLIVPTGTGNGSPFVILPPTVNRGGILVEDPPGTWRVIAPRFGLYRLNIDRVEVQGWTDGGGGALGSRAGGEWHSSVTFGDAFCKQTSPTWSLPGSEYQYEESAASAIVEADAGTEWIPSLVAPALDNFAAGVDLLQSFGTFSVELVRR